MNRNKMNDEENKKLDAAWEHVDKYLCKNNFNTLEVVMFFSSALASAMDISECSEDECDVFLDMTKQTFLSQEERK